MKPRILIVDDDDKNVTLLTVKMEKDGYDTESACNGIEALAKVPEYRPDLILMDVMMPKMDGYEALRRLKSSEETRYIPVIMLTGRSEVEDKVMGFEVGAEDYIIKPFSLREVSARVKSLLRMRALQTRLMETEKMAALGGMVDGIAHEIRNPLTTIGGMARRLRDHETDPQHMKYAERIINSVERLERMLLRIDEYKTILSSTLAPGDIDRVISSAVANARELAEGKDIEFNIDLMPEPPAISMDYNNLKTAVFNVLQNSIEAIEGKGTVTIKTMPSADDTMVIEITDTGSGMDEKQLREVFHPFQTSKLSGAGLGLAVTHRIVSDHGGEIEVESAKGEGTTVTISLHPSKAPAPATEGAK